MTQLFKILVTKSVYNDGSCSKINMGTYYTHAPSAKKAIANVKFDHKFYNYDINNGSIEVCYNFECSSEPIPVKEPNPSKEPTPAKESTPVKKEIWYQPDLFQFLEENGSP